MRKLQAVADDGETTAERIRAIGILQSVNAFAPLVSKPVDEPNSVRQFQAYADDKRAVSLLKSGDEYLRAWAIQLACEDKKPSDTLLKEFARLAKADASPVVRLYLASACQRLSIEQRLPILENLLTHAEDADDHNLPLMYWYATEAVAAQGTAKAIPLLSKTKIPKVREFITKRMTAASKPTAAAGD